MILPWTRKFWTLRATGFQKGMREGLNHLLRCPTETLPDGRPAFEQFMQKQCKSCKTKKTRHLYKASLKGLTKTSIQRCKTSDSPANNSNIEQKWESLQPDSRC